MPEVTLSIHHHAGLHARPLALFVKTAKLFKSDIQVRNITIGKGPANGKSPLALLMLAVQHGHSVSIDARGPDADEALLALKQLIEQNFNNEA